MLKIAIAIFLMLGIPLLLGSAQGATMQLAVGTLTPALTTELNTIASNGWTAASGVIDNRIAGGGMAPGYTICRMILHVAFAASPTAGGAFTGFFLKNGDPATPIYETTPTASFGMQRTPDFVIPVITGQATTDVSLDVRCPAERFKVAGQFTSTGQTTTGSGNTLKILPITLQGN